MRVSKDYMDLIDETSNRSDFGFIIGALKSRPMKRLRGSFYKRKFGTPPTILGCHYIRPVLDNSGGTLDNVDNLIQVDVVEDQLPSLLSPGDFVALRGTDGLPFNIMSDEAG